mmetsp:Transcript_53860/g.151773  ORF Transcript_53860/g.151773 Transcript_53860/m.151773 type:complete len:248 (+) Transcript_53860:727-1470(+)
MGVGDELTESTAEDAQVVHEEHPGRPVKAFERDAEAEVHAHVHPDVGEACVRKLVRPPPVDLLPVVLAVTVGHQGSSPGKDGVEAGDDQHPISHAGFDKRGHCPECQGDEALCHYEDGQMLSSQAPFRRGRWIRTVTLLESTELHVIHMSIGTGTKNSNVVAALGFCWRHLEEPGRWIPCRCAPALGWPQVAAPHGDDGSALPAQPFRPAEEDIRHGVTLVLAWVELSGPKHVGEEQRGWDVIVAVF